MYVSSPIRHKKARIEIIPLIDIMFFLLASFMMVSLSQVHMKGIKVTLPVGQSGETQAKRDYISVSVDKDGNPYFDKEEMDYDKLAAILQRVYQENPEAKVFVRGDANTMHVNVVRVLDILRSVGFYKIAFEIKSEALRAVPAPGVQAPPTH
jgi:biopolymer transport protein ExbD